MTLDTSPRSIMYFRFAWCRVFFIVSGPLSERAEAARSEGERDAFDALASYACTFGSRRVALSRSKLTDAFGQCDPAQAGSRARIDAEPLGVTRQRCWACGAAASGSRRAARHRVCLLGRALRSRLRMPSALAGRKWRQPHHSGQCG